jgi:hypothetical protein
LILFVWCLINGFGADIVRLFESIHPSGGLSIIDNDLTLTSRIISVGINTAYAALDFLIFGFALSALYNFFINKFENDKSAE